MKTLLGNICSIFVIVAVVGLCIAGMIPSTSTPPPPEPAFTDWCESHQEYPLCVKAVSVRAVEIADQTARDAHAVRIVRFCDLSMEERQHMLEIGALGDKMPVCAEEQL